jgi:hypothetical protein
MLRKILGTVGGMIAAFIVIFVAQLALMLVVTPPTPELMQNPEALREWVSNMPVSANLLLAIGYLIGSFVGGFVATKIAVGENGFTPSLIIGILLTVAGVVNFFVTMPGSPIWVIVLCLAIYIPFSLFSHRAAK